MGSEMCIRDRSGIQMICHFKQFFSLARGEYGWGIIVALRAFYGPARVGFAVLLPYTPTEEGANLGYDTINGGTLSLSIIKPAL